MTIEQVARICHDANRAYCIGINDHSQLIWEEAPDWQRESAIQGVCAVLRGVSNPEAQHAAWAADKTAAGWVYGSEKDAIKKTHPCLVPYSELPVEHRLKDHLFFAIVTSLVDNIVWGQAIPNK